jgi:hypothetical protein
MTISCCTASDSRMEIFFDTRRSTIEKIVGDDAILSSDYRLPKIISLQTFIVSR